MQRLPLTDSRLAAALMAVGVEQRMFHVEPLLHRKTEERKTTWYVESPDIADIRQLIKEADPDHRNALEKLTPNHPFLAALAGLENYAILQRWLDRPNLDLCCRPASQNSSMIKIYLDNFASPFHHDPPKVGLQNVAHAAALIVAGFPVHPEIHGEGVFGFPDVSVTMPLTANQCVDAGNILADPRALALPELPGYPPGQHPFAYALSACLNLRLVSLCEEAAWKAPTHFFPGRGTRCALATDSALRRPGFPDTLKQHIGGY